MQSSSSFRCGYITILGRPNVGKSTILNRFVDQKISITSRKPQTTRTQIIGIRTEADYQAVYIDTPGIQFDYDTPVHRLMTREARNSLEQVDVIIFMLEAGKWTAADEKVLTLAVSRNLPVVAVINKIDRLKDRRQLLPYIDRISVALANHEIVPVSAKTGENLDELNTVLRSLLPESPPLFTDDYVTDRSKNFLAAEFIREKLIARLGDELPYRIAVTIDSFDEDDAMVRIKALVWVEEKSQKNIVIGKNGIILKQAGEAARKDMERLFDKQVYLNTWVKVKKNWSQSEELIRELGLKDNQDKQ